MMPPTKYGRATVRERRTGAFEDHDVGSRIKAAQTVAVDNPSCDLHDHDILGQLRV